MGSSIASVSMMRVLADLDALRAAPSGCLAGGGWIYFRWSTALSGVVLFGRPDRDDAAALLRALGLELDPEVAPHAFYVDAEQLEGADPDAFAALVGFYQATLPRAATIYTRLGLVVPGGVAGAVVAGFHRGQVPPFPVQAGTDGAEVRDWVGAPAALHAQLAAIVAERRGAPPIVLSLRPLLADGLDDPAMLARALGMSPRTLQRRLQDAGTTLQREIAAQRVEEAKRRLIETATPITTIALDLGFATSQHFSRTFRAATGVSPSAWRATRR
jgi:AraC-like DNA-binding protein